MDTVVIVILCVLAFLIVALFVFVAVKSKKGQTSQAPDPRIDSLAQSVDSVKMGLNSIKDGIPNAVAVEIGKQNVELQKQFADQNGKVDLSIKTFETSVNDRLSKQNIELTAVVGNLKTEFSSASAAQAKSNADSIAQFQKGISETVNGRLDSISSSMSASIAEISKKVDDSIQGGFKSTGDTMGELKLALGSVIEAQKDLKGVQSSVMDLNTLMKGNQSRGAFGEFTLETILENLEPNGRGKTYIIQDDLGYVKGTDEKVRPDATLVFEENGHATKLCIDSKFPFAQYAKVLTGEGISDADREAMKTAFRNDVRKKYREIADKYIVENVTAKKAVMFIPNDGVFAYISNEFPDLVTEALGLNVVMTCPSTLPAIILVFHSAAAEAERAANLDKMEEHLKGLAVEFKRFGERWDSLQRTLTSAANKSADMTVTVSKMNKKFGRIQNANFSEIEEDDQTDADNPADVEGSEQLPPPQNPTD
jgi:DNA recombination protein RmuC